MRLSYQSELDKQSRLDTLALTMIASQSLDTLSLRAGSARTEAAILLERVREFLRSKSSSSGALPLKAQIIPLNAAGEPCPPREVELRDFNERGLTFDHPRPIKGRRAKLVFDDSRFGKLNAEVDLSWCRYLPGGRYTSGGRFVG